MQVPRKVEILGKKFKVFLVDQETLNIAMEIPEHMRNPGPDGGLRYCKKSIYILNELPLDEQIITFLHEVCHAIDIIAGITQTLSHELIEINAETKANGFYDCFKVMEGKNGSKARRSKT